MTPAPRRPPPSSPVGTERSVYEETDPAVVMKRCRSTRTERRRLMCREHGRQQPLNHLNRGLCRFLRLPRCSRQPAMLRCPDQW